MLDLIIATMPADNLELLETLNRIFDDNRAYYYHPYEKEVSSLLPPVRAALGFDRNANARFCHR